MICFLWHPKWTKYTIWQAADKRQYRGNHMQKKGLICIPQVNNLEDELLRSCHIKQIKELLGSKSNKDFKHDLIVEKNLKKKLLNHDFDIQKFWNRNPENKFREISNGAINIKK